MPLDAATLALACGATLPFLHFVLVRVFKSPDNKVRLMFVSFTLASLIGLVAYFSLLTFHVKGLLTAIFVLGFFCLGYMEAFSMICRGFSLTIMVDLHRKPDMDIDQILEQYGNGKGVDWLMTKRLEGLYSLGMIKKNHQTLELLTPRGYLVGRLGLIFKKVLRLQEGG